MSMPPSIVGQQVLINDDYEGDILDWRALPSQAAVRPSIDYLLYPCVNPGWDNEPRRPGRGRIYKHASPRGYRDWLRAIIHERLSGVAPSERLVFINAWNEWAEGAILEPDQRLGHAWLDATRQALQAGLPRSTTPYAIVHAPPGTDLKQVLSAMQASRMDWKLLITTNPAAEDMIRAALDEARTDAEVHAFDPREGDLLPFLYLADRLIDLEADFALKLCLARPTHASDRSALQALLTKEAISKSVTAFRACSELGVVAPDPYVKQPTAHHAEMASAIAVLRRTTGLRPPPQHDLPQLSGNSFWVRLSALRPLLDAGLDTETFLESRSATNRELAEAITAIITEVVRDAGFSALKLSALLEGAASPQSQ